MLKSLYIRDYAIIDELDVEFAAGLNIVTGETGSGKSILVDGVGLLLGERASSDDVRGGAAKGIVEGLFSIEENDAVAALLEQKGYDGGPELIVRREIAASGRSRAFVNDSPATIGMLRDIGERLIDLHGQHDHQTLLRSETHGRMLDSAGGLESMVDGYATRFDELTRLAEEIGQLRAREGELRRTLEFHEFQLAEIVEIDPKPGELDELEREIRIRENGEQLHDEVSELYGLLYRDNGSVRDSLLRARSLLDRISEIDPSFADRREELAGTIVLVEELARTLQSYSLDIEFSSTELDAMRERVQSLNGLRKKYGGSLESVLDHRALIEREIELARNYDAEIAEREAALDRKRRSVGRLAMKISRKRSQVATGIEADVVVVLMELGIPHGAFDIRIVPRPAGKTEESYVVDGDTRYHSTREGVDTVAFYISTNLGEETKALARTASGGEISRVMLALKTILAKNDRLPLLVFDEIDTGISGRIARKVGNAMRSLADFHQIIAITHLPQIAALSHAHFRVEKNELAGRTVTSISRLDREAQTQEVARLVSGATVTESSLTTARELIDG